jgi:hypothetical protein
MQPPVAKDLLGPQNAPDTTAEIIRNLLENRAYGDLMDSYGLRPANASVSLKYADLASLPAWNDEILYEAAGVIGPAELDALRLRESNAKRDTEKEMWAHQITVETEAASRIIRRVKLAMEFESSRGIMSPAEGVLFLRRAGINVAYELVEAVATIVLRGDTDEAVSTFRELLKTSGPKDLIVEPPNIETCREDVEPAPMLPSDLVPASSLSAEVHTHKIRNREAAILSAEISQAKLTAQDPASPTCVWDELTKLAEKKLGPMVGFSSDGIQYRGRQYQATQVPDVFTIKHLRDRMKRAKTRIDS